MSAFELVIFDCDGVLVDSERITNRVFCAMLNELGVSVSPEYLFEQFVGLSMPQCLELITRLLGKPPPEDFVPALRRRQAVALREQVTPVPGIDGVLASLDVPYCVASSGVREKIELMLGVTGLLPQFAGRIFTVAEVEQPKPAPDVFLHAARSLGVGPASCAVVEDTPVGVRAGVAAGMRVFGFAADTPARRLREAGAHALFSGMRDLPGLLQEA